MNGSRKQVKDRKRSANGRADGVALFSDGDPTARSAYQQRLSEAEMQLTELRTRMESLVIQLAEAEHSRDYFADLFEEAPVGYVLHGFSGDIHDTNRQFRNMIEYRRGVPPSGP